VLTRVRLTSSAPSSFCQVRGPWVCSGYYKPEGLDESHDGEWLKTGDVATINKHGFIRLVDRSKDVIKSGGEWVSSADVENIIMSHPKVRGQNFPTVFVALVWQI
jgi:acyl-CoA synthetase (AMP-forming)/AMP-acid ligase II